MIEGTLAALPAVRPALYDRRTARTTRRRLAMAAFAAITVAAPVVLPISRAVAVECESQIAEQLHRISILPEDVKSMQIVASRGGGQAFTNYRINAWTRLYSCSGYTVVTLAHYCAILQSYTIGDCRVEGARHY